jgi:hypothetical protein
MYRVIVEWRQDRPPTECTIPWLQDVALQMTDLWLELIPISTMRVVIYDLCTSGASQTAARLLCDEARVFWQAMQMYGRYAPLGSTTLCQIVVTGETHEVYKFWSCKVCTEASDLQTC